MYIYMHYVYIYIYMHIHTYIRYVYIHIIHKSVTDSCTNRYSSFVRRMESETKHIAPDRLRLKSRMRSDLGMYSSKGGCSRMGGAVDGGSII